VDLEQGFGLPQEKLTLSSFLSEGNYFWNSGMFAFTVGTIDGQKDP
jgi:mannose-1-phosphate guanylyltransferase